MNVPAKTGNQTSTGKGATGGKPDDKKGVKPKLTAEQKAAAKADRFRTLGAKRVTRALAALEAVKALGNKRSFSYTDEQAKKVSDAISAKSTEVINAFASGSTGFEL